MAETAVPPREPADSPMPQRDEPIRMRDASDEALVGAYRASSGRRNDALESLLSRHERRIYATCVRMVGDRETARDLAQETMVKIIQGLDTFDERAKFTTWMTRIAMNCCISHLRREKVRRAPSLEAPASPERPGTRRDELESVEPSAGQRVELSDDMELLARAIRTLEPEQRAILILRDVRGLDYRDIGQVLGIALGTVKSRLFRARASLRDAMERLEAGGESEGERSR